MASHARPGRLLPWGLALALLGLGPAAAADPFSSGRTMRPGMPRSSGHPAEIRARQQQQLDQSTAARNLEARDGVRAAGRTLDRQSAYEAVRRNPSPQAIRDLERRIDREDDLDARSRSIDAAEVERRLGRPLGPTTRRVLFGSQPAAALELDTRSGRGETEALLRSLDDEARLRRLEAATPDESVTVPFDPRDR